MRPTYTHVDWADLVAAAPDAVKKLLAQKALKTTTQTERTRTMPTKEKAPTQSALAKQLATLGLEEGATVDEVKKAIAGQFGLDDGVRDVVLAKAVADGKLVAGRADHYRDLWDKDPQGTALFIAKLHGLGSPIVASELVNGDGGRLSFSTVMASMGVKASDLPPLGAAVARIVTPAGAFEAKVEAGLGDSKSLAAVHAAFGLKS